MKNYVLALLGLISFTFSACSKTDNADPVNSSGVVSIANAVVIRTGVLDFTNKSLSGNVNIYKKTNGSLILAFEQMQFTSTIDVDVRLAKTSDINNGSIKLFSIKNITDHFYFEIPSNIDINSFDYLFLQSDVANLPVGSTWLK